METAMAAPSGHALSAVHRRQTVEGGEGSVFGYSETNRQSLAMQYLSRRLGDGPKRSDGHPKIANSAPSAATSAEIGCSVPRPVRVLGV